MYVFAFAVCFSVRRSYSTDQPQAMLIASDNRRYEYIRTLALAGAKVTKAWWKAARTGNVVTIRALASSGTADVEASCCLITASFDVFVASMYVFPASYPENPALRPHAHTHVRQPCFIWVFAWMVLTTTGSRLSRAHCHHARRRQGPHRCRPCPCREVLTTCIREARRFPPFVRPCSPVPTPGCLFSCCPGLSSAAVSPHRGSGPTTGQLGRPDRDAPPMVPRAGLLQRRVLAAAAVGGRRRHHPRSDRPAVQRLPRCRAGPHASDAAGSGPPAQGAGP